MKMSFTLSVTELYVLCNTRMVTLHYWWHVERVTSTSYGCCCYSGLPVSIATSEENQLLVLLHVRTTSTLFAYSLWMGSTLTSAIRLDVIIFQYVNVFFSLPYCFDVMAC